MTKNQDLHSSCFSESFCLAVAISRSSSVASLTLNEDDSDESKNISPNLSLPPTYLSMLKKLESLSRVTNAHVSELLESRSGKVKQRWAVDQHTGKQLHLVAGCVPILNDSRIILVSSSSGKGWLIPKGGWESDEELEEGAIRECFEEAGVLGVLGPKFDSFCVETGKALQLRIESSMEESQRTGTPDEKTYHTTRTTSACHLNSLVPVIEVSSDTTRTAQANEKSTTKLTHTHVCMTFFPLYVQAIHDSWPEDSRIRQAFTIDGAYFYFYKSLCADVSARIVI
jgi:8-oxo-dGTP pyrophosphatase MutT (NUDIX family)